MSTNLLPAALYNQAQAKELDRRAIAAGTAGAALMEQAGLAAFNLLRESWPNARRLLVVCGGGNNGGDGYVLARLALEAGMQVFMLAAKPVNSLVGDAKKAADQVLNNPACEWLEEDDFPPLDVIVDGLLGIGISGRVRDSAAELIDKINRCDAPVLALDLPSGLNGDTGIVAGVAVKASITITFIGVKRGLLTGQGPAVTGRLFFDDLDVADAIFESLPSLVQRVDKRELLETLPARRADAHKGTFGHVLLIGGDHGYGGAIIMAAQAAIRCGAGLVTVATRNEHTLALLSRQPEVMVRGIDDVADVAPLIDRASVIVIGPGLGQSAWGYNLLAQVMAADKPQLWDADALNLLAKKPQSSPNRQRVITPHPGEAARLLDCMAAEVQSDRFHSVAQLQQKYGGTVLLKGAGTLVTQGDERLALVAAGNAGMASAGMGDVLSGIVGGLMAQGLSGFDAARLGALLHAMAADCIAEERGQRGMVATDLISYLPLLMNRLV